MRWYYTCKVHECAVFFQRNLYFRELTHDRTGSPEHPKENKRYLISWEEIRCKVHEDSVFSKGIYTPGNSRAIGPVRSNIHKKITDNMHMRWYYACKIHECAVFFKGIYTPRNSCTTGLVRPNIQKKIWDIWVHEMILDVKVHEDSVFSKESILQGSHARSG